MATLLRMSVFRNIRHLTGSSRRYVQQSRNTRRPFLAANSSNVLPYSVSRNNTTQPAAVEVETPNEDSLEQQFHYLDISIKERQKISKRCIERILKLLKTTETPIQSINALLAIRSCGNYLSSCSRQEKTEMLLSMWNLLCKKDVELDVSHFNALLRSYLENEYYEFAVDEFLDEMKTSGVSPNKVTYQLLINCCCQKADLDKAVALLEEMRQRDFPLNASIFNSLIMGYSNLGEIENAINILDIMKNAGVEMSDETFLALMRAYARKGDINHIEEILQMCKSQDISFSSREILDIVHDLIVNNGITDVDKLLQYMPKNSVCNAEEVDTLTKIIKATARDDLIFKILDKFETMSANVGFIFIQGLVESHLSNEKIIELCTYFKRWMRDPYRAAVMKSYARNDGALTIELLRIWKNIGADIRPQYFFPAIVNFGRKYNVQGILDTLDCMVNEFFVNPCIQTITEYAIPYGLSVQRNAKEIRETLLKYNIPEIIVDNAIVANLIDNGMLKRAAAYVHNHDNLYSDEILRYRLIQRLLTGGNFEAFKAIFYKLHKQNKDCPAGEVRMINGVIISNVSMEEYLSGIWALKQKFKPKQIYDIWKFAESLETTVNDELAANLKQYFIDYDLLVENKQNSANVNTDVATNLVKQIEQYAGKNDNYVKNLKGQLLMQYMTPMSIDKFKRLIGILQSENYPFSRIISNKIVQFFCEMQLLEEVDNFMNKLIESGERVFYIDTLFVYAQLLLSNQRFDDALALFESDIRILYGNNGANASSEFLRYVTKNYDSQKALEFYRVLASNDYIEPSREIVDVLITNYLNDDDVENAIKIFKSAAAKYKILSCREALTEKLIKTKNMELLQEVNDSVGSVIGEWEAMCYLVFDFLKCDMPKQARKLLKAPGMLENSKSIDTILQTLMDKRDVKLLEQFLDISVDVKMHKDAIYDYLLQVYVADNDWQKGLNLWTRIQDEDVIPSQTFLPNLASLLKSNLQNIPFACSPNDKNSATDCTP